MGVIVLLIPPVTVVGETYVEPEESLLRLVKIEEFREVVGYKPTIPVISRVYSATPRIRKGKPVSKKPKVSVKKMKPKYLSPRITYHEHRAGKLVKTFRCVTCPSFVKKEQPRCNTCLGIKKETPNGTKKVKTETSTHTVTIKQEPTTKKKQPTTVKVNLLKSKNRSMQQKKLAKKKNVKPVFKTKERKAVLGCTSKASKIIPKKEIKIEEIQTELSRKLKPESQDSRRIKKATTGNQKDEMMQTIKVENKVKDCDVIVERVKVETSSQSEDPKPTIVPYVSNQNVVRCPNRRRESQRAKERKETKQAVKIENDLTENKVETSALLIETPIKVETSPQTKHTRRSKPNVKSPSSKSTQESSKKVETSSQNLSLEAVLANFWQSTMPAKINQDTQNRQLRRSRRSLKSTDKQKQHEFKPEDVSPQNTVLGNELADHTYLKSYGNKSPVKSNKNKTVGTWIKPEDDPSNVGKVERETPEFDLGPPVLLPDLPAISAKINQDTQNRQLRRSRRSLKSTDKQKQHEFKPEDMSPQNTVLGNELADHTYLKSYGNKSPVKSNTNKTVGFIPSTWIKPEDDPSNVGKVGRETPEFDLGPPVLLPDLQPAISAKINQDTQNRQLRRSRRSLKSTDKQRKEELVPQNTVLRNELADHTYLKSYGNKSPNKANENETDCFKTEESAVDPFNVGEVESEPEFDLEPPVLLPEVPITTIHSVSPSMSNGQPRKYPELIVQRKNLQKLDITQYMETSPSFDIKNSLKLNPNSLKKLMSHNVVLKKFLDGKVETLTGQNSSVPNDRVMNISNTVDPGSGNFENLTIENRKKAYPKLLVSRRSLQKLVPEPTDLIDQSTVVASNVVQSLETSPLVHSVPQDVLEAGFDSDSRNVKKPRLENHSTDSTALFNMPNIEIVDEDDKSDVNIDNIFEY